MSELWYWRSNDRIRGPLVTEELEALVLNSRLADSDLIRLESSDEWLPAGEIRKLFLNSGAASPAETAAKLLETAAARRLQGSSPSRSSSFGLGGIASGLSSVLGELLSQALELAARVFQALTGWLGRRGRILVTSLAAASLLVFLASRVIDWSPSDLSRLHRIEAIWRMVRVQPAETFKLSPETTTELEAMQGDLERQLRDQPVSGAAGSRRKTALARREMLYAVRGLREPSLLGDSQLRDRVDQSIESASDYLTGSTPVVETPADGTARAKPVHRSTEIIAIIVIDAVLLTLFAGWWIIGRGRG